jgi:DNA-binding GntR family transcriptional regulator
MILSLADQAYNAIKRDIVTCVLDPGLQIAQSHLVERYQMGLTPIREALKRLEQENLVQSIPRFGYVISPITIEDLQDIFEMRLILEKAAARLAILRASDEQIEAIRKNSTFTYRYQDRKSYEEFLDMNTEFHTSVALTTGNRRLSETLSRLLDSMIRIFYLGLEWKDSAEEMQQEHMTLSDALVKRDADLAEQIIEDQINHSRLRIEQMLTQRILVRSKTTLAKLIK